MTNKAKRYIFIDYENLKRIKVKKLQSVCDKFYILINDKNKTIPFSLVTKMQKLGNGVKWIAVDTKGTQNLNYHIIFLLGKLHYKLNKDVEFVVISNDKEIDPIISYITDQRRYCIRVRRGNKGVKSKDSLRSKGSNSSSSDSSPQYGIGEEDRNKRLDKVIHDSKKRLVIIGDRPMAVSDLYEFISLHNQEMASHFEMSEIVHEMEKRNDIQLVGKQVIYNF